jgi:DNA integrity scanning protein DisA with diadenylate cyclase activity
MYRVKAIGIQPLESFKDLLTNEEYRKYKSSTMHGKTWFDLTSNIFVAFLFQVKDALDFLHYSFIALEILSLVQCYLKCLICQATTFLQQEITKASDEATRKYMEETPKDERSDYGMMAVMRVVAKNKVQSFKGQFSKYTAIANPKLGDEFFKGGKSNYLL